MSCGVFIYLFFFPQLFLLSDNDGQAFSRKRSKWNGRKEKGTNEAREIEDEREREKKRERKREREMVRV